MRDEPAGSMVIFSSATRWCWDSFTATSCVVELLTFPNEEPVSGVSGVGVGRMNVHVEACGTPYPYNRSTIDRIEMGRWPFRRFGLLPFFHLMYKLVCVCSTSRKNKLMPLSFSLLFAWMA